MDTKKLRMKIGIHEFEAEGDADIVNQKFEEFKKLVADYDDAKQNHTPPDTGTPNIPPQIIHPGSTLVGDVIAARLSKVVKVEAKKPLVLSALPQGGQDRAGDAALVLLLAYKVFRQQELVSGMALLEGMKASGYTLTRVDRPLMQRLIDAEPESLVMRAGKKRGVTYRLTAPGEARAKQLAEEIFTRLG